MNFSCPFCHGKININGEVRCVKCDSVFSLKNGVVDFQIDQRNCNHESFSPNFVYDLIEKMTEENWDEIVRAFVSNINDPETWLNILTAEGQFAWINLANVNPDSIVIDLECGFGSFCSFIAPFAQQVVAMDTRKHCVEFTKKRLEHYTNTDNAVFIIWDDNHFLPLPAKSADCVVFAGTSNLIHRISKRGTFLHFLIEIKRVLKNDGQLIFIADNRFDYHVLKCLQHRIFSFFSVLRNHVKTKSEKPKLFDGFSFRNYKTILKLAGFQNVDIYGLSPGKHHVREVISYRSSNSSHFQSVQAGLKEKLKKNSNFVPAFGIIGYTSPNRETMFLNRLKSRISSKCGCY